MYAVEEEVLQTEYLYRGWRCDQQWLSKQTRACARSSRTQGQSKRNPKGTLVCKPSPQDGRSVREKRKREKKIYKQLRVKYESKKHARITLLF